MITLRELAPVLAGFGIGVAIAAPVGPMSVLCMRRTLTRGWRWGVATGVGIAIGDGVYALVAALGLAGVTHFMLAYERPLHAAAGLILTVLAWRTLSRRTPADARASTATGAPASSGGVAGALGGAVLLTLTNPPTIVSFVAVFTALAPPGGFVPGAAVATVIGVFLGSVCWWCCLTALVSGARLAVGPGMSGWLDRGSALLLGLLGLNEFRRALESR